ncbi:MAG: RHS domain-containing protein [Desulfobulbaceae bacterium]|nr:RHS domain-containing protein [Desulfobulbaceae bacterium]
MVASIGSLAGLLTQAVTTSDPRTYYYISDHLTTAQLLVDDFGEVVWQGNYKPFGEVDIVVNTLENNFRFPGQYYDSETGLHYNWHRYYDPATGRYISADPIGLAGGMNLYAYVGGNPLNKKDRKGLYKGDEFDGLSPPFGPDPSPSNGPPRGPFGTICGQEGSDSARWIPDITPRACQRHDNCYDRCARNCYGYWCKTLCDMQLGASNPPYGGATFWFGREAYDAARAKYGCEGCNE